MPKIGNPKIKRKQTLFFPDTDPLHVARQKISYPLKRTSLRKRGVGENAMTPVSHLILHWTFLHFDYGQKPQNSWVFSISTFPASPRTSKAAVRACHLQPTIKLITVILCPCVCSDVNALLLVVYLACSAWWVKKGAG